VTHPTPRQLTRVTAPARILCVALVLACDGGGPTEPEEYPVQFQVLNYLVAPVHLAVDGSPYMSMFGSTVTTMVVSSRAQWVTWISAKPMDENRVPIPDDIQEQAIAVSGISHALEITNVIGDHTYFTTRIYNDTPASVSIGLFDGTSVICASKLPGSSPSSRKFTQVGYYRLLEQTEMRAYSDPANCTGSYVAWPGAALRNLQAKSGLLLLTLNTVPTP
jgi:hypothetical protein